MSDDELEHYAAALDEIWRLRAILAYESQVTDAHHEGYKTFPKSRKQFAIDQAERMRTAARGDSWTAYHKIAYPHQALKSAGASVTLTRSQWEARNE